MARIGAIIAAIAALWLSPAQAQFVWNGGVSSWPITTTCPNPNCALTAASATVATAQSGAGSYDINDVLSLSGGTGTSPTFTITHLQVQSATVAAGGTGGTDGAGKIVTGTTGTGTKFQASVTVTSGAIASVQSITVAGDYTVRPTDITQEPVTGDSLSGAKLAIKTGPLTISVTTAGAETTNLTNPVATTVSPNTGTGATLTVTWNYLPSFYGADATKGYGFTTSGDPLLIGVPQAPTATLGTNTTQIATTAFVLANAASGFPITLGSTSIAAGSTTTTIAGLTLTTPVLGVATGTSLALGGATLGSDALAVTGSATFSSNVVVGTYAHVGMPGLNAADGIYQNSNNGATIYAKQNNLNSVGLAYNTGWLASRGQGATYAWIAGSDISAAASVDTSLNSPSAGVVAIGTNNSNALGSLNLATLTASGSIAAGLASATVAVDASAAIGRMQIASTNNNQNSAYLLNSKGNAGTNRLGGLYFLGNETLASSFIALSGDAATYQLSVYQDGGVTIGAPAGASKGAGTLNVANGTTVGGNIINTGIGSDATHTDRTVCEDTTTNTFLSGSGAAGICLGTSSLRFKFDVHPLQPGLSEVMALRPIDYRYLPGYGGEGVKYGFAAEQVINVMPELVGLDLEGHPNTVDWAGVVPVLVRAIQEQQEQIAALKR